MEHQSDVVWMANTFALAGDNIDSFMRRIMSIPILDRQTELALATLMEAGSTQAQKVPKDKRPTSRAARIILAGDEARIRLIFHNLRFAAWAARQSMGFKQTSDREVIREDRTKNSKDRRDSIDALKNLAGYSMPLEDRIQEAILGLILAADHYLPTKRAKFTTLAGFYIVRRLRNMVSSDCFRDGFSFTIATSLLQVMATQRKLRRLTGQEPNAQMIAADVSKEGTQQIVGVKAASFRIEEATLYPQQSLEEIDHDLYRYDPATGEWLNLADVLQDVNAPDPFERAQFNALGNALEDVLDGLSEREAGVIAMRFGLTNGEPKTLNEIGKVYGITQERVRQIETKAMGKLRHPSRSDSLRGFLRDDEPPTPYRYQAMIDRHTHPELYGQTG